MNIEKEEIGQQMPSISWFENKNYGHANKIWAGYIIMIIGIVGSLRILMIEWPSPIEALGVIGFIFLITMLVGMNLLSDKHEFNTGEVRRAIAITFVFVFFSLLIVGESIDTLNLEPTSIVSIILDKYWAILSTIIAFYFIGRTVETKKRIS